MRCLWEHWQLVFFVSTKTGYSVLIFIEVANHSIDPHCIQEALSSLMAGIEDSPPKLNDNRLVSTTWQVVYIKRW